ncbi:hypothetical protein UCRPC4_g04953 [Phaeomoniella chlamydospora]|uniref:Uncharacterized protein n=1 Tax=Phaeomoniella chlamydospora TaxID=158046 RepID=A0A0G2E5Z0_PHACM|nr:hypothetical protein UCRPC4_g04953 [Phaeomoniella chlamydospora]
MYIKVRPYEPLFRDPWWIYTTLKLTLVVRNVYDIPFGLLFRRSPRFGMMLVSMAISVAFIVVDVVSSIVPNFSSTIGINPYWKFALIFKCFCDTIILDDFKTALEKLRAGLMESVGTVRFDDGEDAGLGRQRRGGIDRGGLQRNFSVSVSPTATREGKQKSWRSRFGSISAAQGESYHIESASNVPSQSSHFSNESDMKDGLEMEQNGRINRADFARETVGKVGTKLSHLPGLSAFGSPRKQSTTTATTAPLEKQTTRSPTILSGSTLDNTSTFRKSQTRSIPDPYQIPTDEELEADPTGQKTFEERRRREILRDESCSLPITSHPHPGVPWGDFEEEELGQHNEPWGQNQAAPSVAATQTKGRSVEASRSISRQNKSGSPPEEEKISSIDAL